MVKIVISLVLGIVLAVILFMLFIPYLHRLKFGQTIRVEGPKNHYKKNGTPTMGGVVIIIGTMITFLGMVIFLIPWDQKNIKDLFLLIYPFLSYGILGLIDDYLIIVKKHNQGIKPKVKFLVMLGIAGGYYYGYLTFGMENILNVFGKTIDLGFFYGVFLLLFMAAVTNAVNITDGIDGLAGGLVMIALIAFLGIAYYHQDMIIVYFALAMLSTLMGFMIFNINPASIFMGNTGSYALGGALGGIAILIKAELLLLIIGIIFVIETLSVILQAYYFKVTKGKRFFKMAPLHHHLELSGYTEWQIDLIFWSLGIIFGILGLVMGVKLF